MQPVTALSDPCVTMIRFVPRTVAASPNLIAGNENVPQAITREHRIWKQKNAFVLHYAPTSTPIHDEAQGGLGKRHRSAR
jgi:hypothetical protein